MKNLISMVDFVLEQRNEQNITNIRRFWNCEKYVKFLKQPLELWMFVPCKLVDGVWVVLEEPNSARVGYVLGGWDFKYDMEKYQQARERCLFDWFEIDNSFVTHISYASFFYPISCLHEQTIEYLVKYNLTLTATAQKKLSL